MILNALITLVYYMLSVTLGALNIATFVVPDPVFSTLNTLIGYSMILNQIFPVTTLYVMLGATLTLEAGVALFKFVLWTYEQVRHVVRS